MWTKDEADELYAPVKLDWTDDDQAKLDAVLSVKLHSKCAWAQLLKRKHSDLYAWLLSRHPLLDSSYSTLTKLYWLVHKLEFFQKCPVCGKTKHMHKNIDGFERGYFRACCRECAAANPERQKKIADTTESHYGSRNFFTSECGKAKTKKFLESMGVTNVFQLESVKKKSCETRKANFGHEYTMQSPEKRKLASDNYMKKTGHLHQFSDPDVIAKSKKTLQDKIDAGVDIKAEFKRSMRVKRYNSILSLSDEVTPLFTLEHFMQFDSAGQYCVLFDWHCNKCGKDFKALLDQNLVTREHLPARCPTCHPISAGSSRPEYEIKDFLESCGIDGICMHDRSIISPYEIDIAIPSKMVGIEFDGLYFHSETSGGKPQSYHMFKTDEAKKHGYQLVHVFEDEWTCKRSIVESRLKSILGISGRRIYARECETVHVSFADAREFLDRNHLQGWSSCSISFGLHCKGELVALMTFGKPRFSKAHEWELIRYCSKLGTSVVGGASKLLKGFERECCPKSLVSYADCRWSAGKMYEKLGFVLDHVSSPNYWYLMPNVCKRFSRVMFQKFKLPRILSNFNPELSEVENMRNNGYDRIFDCGNLVYVKSCA